MKSINFLIVFLSVYSLRAQTCPTVYFDVPGNFESTCHGEGVSVPLGICGPVNYTVDSVEWSAGGSYLSTLHGTAGLTYTLSIPSGSATAYSAKVYLHAPGGICMVEAQYFGDSEPCSVSSGDKSLMVRNPGYEASLYTIPETPEESEMFELQIELSKNYGTENVTVFLDDSEVAGPVSIPNGGGTPVSATLYSSRSLREGQHVLEAVVLNSVSGCKFSRVRIIDVRPKRPCDECFTYRPVPGVRYWISAWVKEDVGQSLGYTKSSIVLRAANTNTAFATLLPSGDVIEGWQRIAGEFTVPSGTTAVDIELKNLNTSGSTAAYFDDIRIHPFNASMKSYVYDPQTLWLVAELDDNNYATFYEYDREGQLIRVKKETERGVMTIKESRSSNSKH